MRAAEPTNSVSPFDSCLLVRPPRKIRNFPDNDEFLAYFSTYISTCTYIYICLAIWSCICSSCGVNLCFGYRCVSSHHCVSRLMGCACVCVCGEEYEWPRFSDAGCTHGKLFNIFYLRRV